MYIGQFGFPGKISRINLVFLNTSMLPSMVNIYLDTDLVGTVSPSLSSSVMFDPSSIF